MRNINNRSGNNALQVKFGAAGKAVQCQLVFFISLPLGHHARIPVALRAAARDAEFGRLASLKRGGGIVKLSH
jgi:hypothetical protein